MAEGFQACSSMESWKQLNMAERAMLRLGQSLLGSIRLASGGNLHLTTDGINAPPEQINSENAEAGPPALYCFEATCKDSRRND